jgi:hypothetical protein
MFETNSMQRSFRDITISTVNQGFSRILWKKKFKYIVHTTSPPVIILSQYNPAHSLILFLKYPF